MKDNNEQIKIELCKQQADMERNAGYGTASGCQKQKKAKVSICKWEYRCKGEKGHATERSKFCKYTTLKGDMVQSALNLWTENKEQCELQLLIVIFIEQRYMAN